LSSVRGGLASGIASHAEGLATSATTTASHAEGQGTTASGLASHAEGFNTKAIGENSHAEGYLSIASNSGAHAEGGNSTALVRGGYASGYSSHAEGQATSATTTASHAEGLYSLASGVASHAQGSGTTASGNYSHVEGEGCIASGVTSHAQGRFTIAGGSYSHSSGNYTKSMGSYTYAGGSGSESYGICSFAHGTNSVASGTTIFVFGDAITGTTNNTTYVDYLNVKRVLSTAFVNDIRIDANGNLTTNVSDERLKENITPLIGSLNKVKALQGVTYQWKDRNAGTDAIKLGFIAQQVESVEPLLVFTNKDENEYKGLHIDGIIPLLVESVKELEKGITSNDSTQNKTTIPSYTPTSSTDTNGNLGNVTIDDDYLYIKTSTGWKRTNLESF